MYEIKYSCAVNEVHHSTAAVGIKINFQLERVLFSTNASHYYFKNCR